MGKSLQKVDLKKAKVFSLNKEMLTNKLEAPGNFQKDSKLIYFPNEKGELIPFNVSEAPVLSPQLAKKYPQIKSYTGYSTQNKNDRIRFSVSHNGIQSMIINANGEYTTFMQKASRQGTSYVVYRRDAKAARDTDFVCHTKASVEKSIGGAGKVLKLVDDQVLRKYRIAVSTTGEYTAFHGGTVADALAAINATLTRVNEVFETDLGVSLELVPNNDEVIFTNAGTDPYTGNLNSQVQSTLSAIIGEANYDVGHLFDQDTNNGNAGFIGSVCFDGRKGSAFSSGSPPEGDIFDLDFVGHELGHQFGANHTWSFQSEGTLVQTEPGSGTTIMGYAGIAQENNVAPNGDDYFHYNSILQITTYLETTSCAMETPLTNTPPVLDPVGDFVIPKSTAFVLTGSATDTNGDVLTYTWEQIDDGVVTQATFGPTNPSGANFRSQRPSTNPERYFPALSRVVTGNLVQTDPSINDAWETVSDVARELNFALTVRDNASGGGQVSSALVNVQVVNNSGPFAVTSQTTNETYTAGTTQNITWDVADTDRTPINAQTVDILLSTDGGGTFSSLLAENVPNDGAHVVLLPAVSTTTARIMVLASDNIFFAINAADFTIEASEVVLNFADLEFEVCQPDNIITPFVYETDRVFNEEVTFGTTGAPAGLNVSFSQPTAVANDTPIDITFSNTGGIAVGNYPITVTATSASITKEVVIGLNVYDANFSNVVLSTPTNGAVDVSINPMLEWEEDPSYTSYDIEIATDIAFSSIVESTTVIFNSYTPSTLEELTDYFWRVKPKNECGEGAFGTAFNFTTIAVNCGNPAAAGLPLEISAVATPTVTSTISFPDDLPIADVNVNLDIDHSFLADLIISLTSPQGTTVILTSNSCGERANIDAIFDDDATAFACGINPGINGTVKPLGSLASFNGESSLGEWTLTVVDTAPVDGGSINGFSLEICVEGEFRPDADGDGVFDDGDDLCLGTPAGTEVDTDGCPVFRFPSDNFAVAIQSESCSSNNDGAIQIEAVDTTIDYTVVVNGNGVNENTSFTDSYVLENLVTGTYSVCISGTDGTIDYEELCFDITVNEPAPLAVVSKVLENGNSVALTLEGGDLYYIELNGVVVQTQEPEITVDLKSGANSLKVFTDLPCQGTYEEQIFIGDKPVIFPNPLVNTAKIFFGPLTETLNITIHTSDGRLVSSKRYDISGNEIDLDFTGLPSGMYFVSVNGATVKETYKVLKR
ncbi:MAG: reprolysin-like metallopeptidase [Saonia sp.]